MGEIAVISANTGITAMGKFRVSDLGLGRLGCPIFATDRLAALLPPYKEPRSVKYWWYSKLLYIARR